MTKEEFQRLSVTIKEMAREQWTREATQPGGVWHYCQPIVNVTWMWVDGGIVFLGGLGRLDAYEWWADEELRETWLRDSHPIELCEEEHP